MNFVSIHTNSARVILQSIHEFLMMVIKNIATLFVFAPMHFRFVQFATVLNKNPPKIRSVELVNRTPKLNKITLLTRSEPIKGKNTPPSGNLLAS